MSQYNALMYTGRALSYVIQEYKTRRSIELKKDIPYVKDDGFSIEEISYYNQLRSIGVELTKVPARKQKKDEVKKVEKKKVVKEEPDVSEEVQAQFHETEVPEVEVVDTDKHKEKEEDIKLVVDDSIEVEEGLDGEISEYLDINFTEEELHELAEKLETSDMRSNLKKGTVISRLVENSYDDVYRLVIGEM